MTETGRRKLFRAISRLVPAGRRADWLHEWEAELAARSRERSKPVVIRDALEDVLRTRWQLRNRSMLLHDIRYTLRTFLKSPGWTATALGTLALGLGATITIFTLLYGIVIRPLPYPESDRLIAIHRIPWGWQTISWPVWEDLHERQQVCEDVGVFAFRYATIRLGETPEEIIGSQVSTNLFGVLQVQPALGRAFTPEEDLPGAADAVILTHGFWLTRFAGDPEILGQTIELREVPHTIVGVMPEGFTFPTPQVAFFTPLARASRNPSAFYLQAVGRLKEGVSVAAAREYVTGTAWVIPAREDREERIIPLDVKSLLDYMTWQVRPTLIMFQLAVLAVLLIGALNVASLMLMRQVMRQRETAVRIALGAGRSRLLRLALTESGLLGLLGGLLGMGLAAVGVRVLLGVLPSDILLLERVALNAPVVVIGLLTALAAGGLIGLIPILKISRRGIAGALRAMGRSMTGGAGRARVQNVFVGTQLTLTAVLLIVSGLLLRSFIGLASIETGFETNRVLVADFPLSRTAYATPAARMSFYDELVSGLEARPGIERAAVTVYTPLTGSWSDSRIAIEGIEEISDDDAFVEIHQPGTGYFETMGIPLLAGRDLTPVEIAGAEPVTLVNETIVRRFFPESDPIGRRLRIGGEGSPWLTVIGMVGDVVFRSLDAPPANQVYVPWSLWNPLSSLDVAIRCTGDPRDQAATVTEVFRSLDPDIPPPGLRPLRDIVADSLANNRLLAVIVGIFGLTALLLALIGIYGVVAYGIARRSREFGIRLAVGASPGRIIGDVVRQSFGLLGLSLAAGVAGALLLSRVVQSFLVNVEARDPLIFVSVTLLVALIALAATWLPARRAGRLDPVTTLRIE